MFLIAARSGVPIGPHSQYPAEQEVLFRPNLRLRVAWLGGRTALSLGPDLLRHPTTSTNGYSIYISPHALTTEMAEAERVFVVVCEQVA